MEQMTWCSTWRRDALGALGLLILAVVLGLTVNLFHPRGVSLRNPDVSRRTAGVAGGPRVVSADTLQAWRAKGVCLLLDARPPKVYAAAHIPGALNLPVDFLEDSVQVLQRLPRDIWLVCYCDGPPCDLGERLAFELQGWGFQRVAVYEGGMSDWLERREPVEKGGAGR